MEAANRVESSTTSPGWRLASPFWHGLAFVLGFAAVFVALGAVVGAIGSRWGGVWLPRASGIVVILFGLHFLGVVRLGWLYRTRHVGSVQGSAPSYARSALVGGAFAVGWTPCVTPILTAVLALGSTAGVAQSAVLLAFYALGLGVPFLAMGLAVNGVSGAFKRLNPYLPWVERASGLLLIFVGFLVFTQSVIRLNRYFAFLPYFDGGSASVTGLSAAAAGIAFAGGVLSFVSPCVLPLAPIYVAYLAGTALKKGPSE